MADLPIICPLKSNELAPSAAVDPRADGAQACVAAEEIKKRVFKYVHAFNLVTFGALEGNDSSAAAERSETFSTPNDTGSSTQQWRRDRRGPRA